jgi:hypothetical protein
MITELLMVVSLLVILGSGKRSIRKPNGIIDDPKKALEL